jgi:hypothetical protein
MQLLLLLLLFETIYCLLVVINIALWELEIKCNFLSFAVSVLTENPEEKFSNCTNNKLILITKTFVMLQQYTCIEYSKR